jgi:hypothetical protein
MEGTHMAQAISGPHRRGFMATLRLDQWWVGPVTFLVGLGILFGYLTVSAFLENWDYIAGDHAYVSPVFEPGPLAFFTDRWERPIGGILSPAFFILWGPGLFRLTCYYFRKAYYRSYFMSPPACAVGDARSSYTGESRLPLIFQNLHRYFMYIALILVLFQWYNAVMSFHDNSEGWGIGLGSIFVVTDVVFLSGYLFGCHALRHWIGGGLDCYSCSAWKRARKSLWDRITVLNTNHAFWAWGSLITVAGTDLYIRLVANGTITDPNTWSNF